jgi:hypothetical protein
MTDQDNHKIDNLDEADENIESDGNNDEKVEIIEEYVEGYWNCSNCSAKRKGSEQSCGACGAIRGENVEFYCDDDAPVITDEKELERARAGPDWICRFCGNTSPSASKKCTGCGSLRGDGKKRQVKDEPLTAPPAKNSHAARIPPAPPKSLPLGAKIGCGFIAFIVLILLALSCQQKIAQIEVTETSWQRSIELEEYQTVQETAWRNEVPAGARQLSSKREIRHYNQLPDGDKTVEETYAEKVKVGIKRLQTGKKNLGNGSFKKIYKTVPKYENETKTRTVKKQKYRKEPVYDEKITYNINKWKAIETVVASGRNDEPKWPETKAAKSSASAKIGDYRNGKKSEVYKVKARKVGEKEEFVINEIGDKPLTYDQFMKLKKGSKWEAVFTGLGNLSNIKFEPDKKN